MAIETRHEAHLYLRGLKHEERISAAETSVASLGGRVAEFTGSCEGLMEEVSMQSHLVHVDERHARWSREFAADLRGRYDAIEREVRSLACRASSAASLEVQMQHEAQLQTIEAEVAEERLFRKKMTKAFEDLKESCRASQTQAVAQIRSEETSPPLTEHLGDVTLLSLDPLVSIFSAKLKTQLQNSNDVLARLQVHEKKMAAMLSQLAAQQDAQKPCRCSEVSKELAGVRELARAAHGGVKTTKVLFDALREEMVEIARQVPQDFKDLRRELREEVAELTAVDVSIWEALEAVEPVMEQLRQEVQGIAAKAIEAQAACQSPLNLDEQEGAAAAQKGIVLQRLCFGPAVLI